jgi:hypothetical protein
VIIRWPEVIIVLLGILVIVTMRRTQHKNRLGYIAMAFAVLLFVEIAVKLYLAGDISGFWTFAVAAAVLAIFGKPLSDGFMSLTK